jgi:hypothetical protein
MKQLLLTSLLSLVAAPAFAQDQFEYLQQIEVQQSQKEAATTAEIARKAEAAQVREEAREESARRVRQASAQSARQQALEASKVRDAENKRMTTRSERMEDEDRDFEREFAREERKLKLQEMKAKAARSNDYIDAELREKAAKTDVIQSDADASRNVTTGAKALMEDAGTAEINRSNKLIETN